MLHLLSADQISDDSQVRYVIVVYWQLWQEGAYSLLGRHLRGRKC